MSFSLTPEEVLNRSAAAKKPYAIGIGILIALALAGGSFIIFYGVSERQRELLLWQQTLSQVAQARAGAIATWVELQQKPLERFAEDDEVRLNTAEIMKPSADLDLGARGYLRNWLVNAARNNGFVPSESPTSSRLDAPTSAADLSSLAILDKNGAALVSAGLFPSENEVVANAIKNFNTTGTAGLIDLFMGPDERPYIGFVHPLYDVNGTAEENRLGLVVGIKPALEIFPLLNQPGETVRSAEALLLRANGGAVQVVSPLPERTLFATELDAASKGSVEAIALASPGTYIEGQNYKSEDTMAVSRKVEGTPWVVSYQVGRAEILGTNDQRLAYQMGIFAALLGIVIMFIYAAWRKASEHIARDMALEQNALARKFEFQSRLLRLITDSQRNHIMIADTEGRVRFANATLARHMGANSDDLIGKPMAAAVGPDTARRLAKRSQEASLSNKAVITVDRVQLDEADETKFRVVQTQHIPLEDNSEGPDVAPTRGTLVVEEDITDVVMEREKRERTLRAIVDALVAVVDRRDPYAAQHSSRVARLARSVAGEMGLSDIDGDATELAGALLNLGKLLVPASILTKQTALDAAEMKVVHDSLLNSADIVAPIEFEGPVVKTLRQSLEKVDGSGYPDGLKGDEILVTARILAVANAFVALISPRAHRAGMPIDDAVKVLQGQVDKAYDRGVVAALVSYIENHGGREVWQGAAPTPAIASHTETDENNPWQR